jgi:hypothetical protein
MNNNYHHNNHSSGLDPEGNQENEFDQAFHELQSSGLIPIAQSLDTAADWGQQGYQDEWLLQQPWDCPDSDGIRDFKHYPEPSNYQDGIPQHYSRLDDGQMLEPGYQYVDGSQINQRRASPIAGPSRQRPARTGLNSRNFDGSTSRVYAPLPSFPQSHEPLPDEATLEDICVYFPNHLQGPVLDAFLQWMWTANDIYNFLTQQSIKEFKQVGVMSESAHNRANFLNKRLDTRMGMYSAESLNALCEAPKMRRCLRDGSERYGRCKMQGKVFNPRAQPLRRLGDRPNNGRR